MRGVGIRRAAATGGVRLRSSGQGNAACHPEARIWSPTDPRYADWRTALSEVQGIYLITDASNGKQYVGKADGAKRILGRWTSYTRDEHGGNVALRGLAFTSAGDGTPTTRTHHARHFVFSILRVFGPSTSSTEVNASESHYQRALMTREFGLNRG